MNYSQELLEKLKKLLPQKDSNAFYAKRLEVTVDDVTEMLKIIRGKKPKIEVNTGTVSRKVNVDKGIIESTVISDFEPRDDTQLAKLHKIDLGKYMITNYWSKLLPSGKFTSSVFCKRKQDKDYTFEDFKNFLEAYIPKAIINHKEDKTDTYATVDAEVSIYDFHLGKKTLDATETIRRKKEQYISCLQELVRNIRSCYNIRKLVFPISNDFFHTDNYHNQTTNFTPQDVLTTYDNEYEEGFDLLVTAINYLDTVSESVEVILVQGNHDRTKSYYLAHALEVVFKNNSSIKFKRDHSVTKNTVLGNTFIGYHHGNCKIEELPLIFATGDHSEEFGNARFREVHTGDKHHYMAKEVKGVRIQQMPSLSGTDSWHEDNNYVNNIRAGLALVYDPLKGKVAEFESRI